MNIYEKYNLFLKHGSSFCLHHSNLFYSQLDLRYSQSIVAVFGSHIILHARALVMYTSLHVLRVLSCVSPSSFLCSVLNVDSDELSDKSVFI